MLCIDFEDGDEPIQIWGEESADNWQRLEVILTPCNYIHTELNYDRDSVHPECVTDLNKQIEYMQPS